MITRMIRDEGAMNAVISSGDISDDNLRAALESLPDMNGLDLAKEVTCQQPYIYKDIVNQKYRIAALDYGVKENILRILSSLDCEVKVFPASSSSSEILDYNPDGIFLSNGPGDPEACTYAIQMVKELLGHKPIFGICLGHQFFLLHWERRHLK